MVQARGNPVYVYCSKHPVFIFKESRAARKTRSEKQLILFSTSSFDFKDQIVSYLKKVFMLKKYFSTTLRYLWRHRLFTALNIAGLAVSISASWIIFRIVDYEFSYDRDLANKEKIYRVVTGFVFDEKESYNGGVSAPIYQGVRQQTTGLDYVVPVLGKWITAVEVNTANGKPLIVDDPSGVVATDSTYFTMVPYHWILGNKSTAFKAPENVVLTEERAKKYFPGKKPEEIFHQRLTYYSGRDTIQRTITGIVADLNTPTEFTAQEFCSLPTKAYELSAWTNTNGSDKLYLQLKQGAEPAKVLSQIQGIADQKSKELDQKNVKHINFKYKRWFQLLPLKDSHFSTFINEYQVRKASKPVLYGLVGIGVFLLLLACINYINMSVAAMPQRAKEIGVRKTLGSSQGQLIAHFLPWTIWTRRAYRLSTHERNRHPKSAGCFGSRYCAIIIQRIFAIGGLRHYSCDTGRLVGNEQMAAELCIPHPVAMVDVFAGRVNRYCNCHDYGQFPGDQSSGCQSCEESQNRIITRRQAP